MTIDRQPVDTALLQRAPTQRIALVGGSNTIKKAGYSKLLKNAFGEENVVRHALGASTSLYGLYNSVISGIFSRYDTFIFEYTINDISYFNENLYSLGQIENVLFTWCKHLKEYGKQAVFILSTPRYSIDEVLSGSEPVSATYKRIAKQFGFQTLDVTRHLIEKGLTREDLNRSYADDMHYSVKVSEEIGREILSQIHDSTDHSPNTNEVGTFHSLQEVLLKSIPATELEIRGTHEEIERTSALTHGKAIRLHPNASITLWSGRQLLGLLCNTFEASGYIRIYDGEKHIIKNMFDGFFENGKSRIFLKQLAAPVDIGDHGITISCDVQEPDFENHEIQPTKHERPPLVRLEDTCLEVLSAVVSE